MPTFVKRTMWAVLLVVGLPLLHLSTQTMDWGLVLIGKMPMVLWAFWTYDLLTERKNDAGTSE